MKTLPSSEILGALSETGVTPLEVAQRLQRSRPRSGRRYAALLSPVARIAAVIVAMAGVGLFFFVHPTDKKLAATTTAAHNASPTGPEEVALIVAIPAPTPPDAEATPAPSRPAAALPEDSPAAPDPKPAPTPESAQPAVVVDAPPVPAEPVPEPPPPSETAAATPSPIAPAQAPATVHTQPDLSDVQRQALLSQGDAFFSAGDVTSARLFYQRGADAGDSTAALRLGGTFDAAFLERAHLGHVPSELKKAVSWYRRARDLGNAEAEILLKSLHAN